MAFNESRWQAVVYKLLRAAASRCPDQLCWTAVAMYGNSSSAHTCWNFDQPKFSWMPSSLLGQDSGERAFTGARLALVKMHTIVTKVSNPIVVGTQQHTQPIPTLEDLRSCDMKKL